MFLYISQFDSFKSKRLIFKKPESAEPKIPKFPEEILPISEKLAIRQNTQSERNDLAETTAQKLAEQTEHFNNELKTKSKRYYEILSSLKDPKQIEKIQKKIESDKISMLDLQGGWEFLGLTDKNQHEKYARLAEIYLKKETDPSGQEIFVVNNELDNTYKTKYGIGAGDILPPSITEVEITDLQGVKRHGKREIKNNRVGYYEISTETYIPIFGGYKIRPINFLDEKSREYQNVVEEEKPNYEKKIEAAKALDTGSAILLDSRSTENFNASPAIGSLQSLRTASSETLKGTANPQETLEITEAQKDIKRIEALLDHFHIGMPVGSEVAGGLYLTTLDGKGASMLGWNDECEKKEKFSLLEAAKTAQPNNTVKLIKALQNGGPSYKFLDYEFSGNYEFALNHLDTLNRLAEKDIEELKAILNEQGGPKKAIDSTAVVREIFKQKTLPTGMSMQQTVDFINKNRTRLGFLLGDKGQKDTILDLLKESKKTKPIDKLNYRWNSLTQYLDYPANGGKKCCAFAVSTLLGLGEDSGSTRGKMGGVRGLATRLLSGNRNATMKEGIVFGFENYGQGDVLVFNGGKLYKEKQFAHVAIVRDKVEIEVQDPSGRYIGKEEYLILIDDGDHLQATIVPVKRDSYTQSYLAKALEKSSSRNKYLKKYPQLAAIYAERRLVRVKANAGWWGDALTGNGHIAFGIRTIGITQGFRVAQS